MLTQSHRRLLSGALIISTVLGISYYLTEPTYFHPTPAALRVVADSTPFIELDDEELRRHRRAILDLRDASIGRLHVLNRDWDAKNELVAGRYQLRSLDLDAYDSEMRFFWHSLMSSEYDRAISRSPDLHWREKNPGFEVRTMVDIALASWMRSTFGDAAIVAEFISLPKRILQIDAWRYIAVFILGGVWCDSDTAAVKVRVKLGLFEAIGRIFERGRKIRDGVEDVAGVLDWTGPGLFTDCVFRYLKARWGFDFDTLEDFDHPIRIGNEEP
ncbi:hypothetical protein RQP46_003766 [Phenoliferia psychrophenolica]